ncbi:hypothetical protein BDU57DRAFT_457023 [Ampelomyces quisqualis]|uniref:Rhodopsin domain-containing protein n=1 Tax=Ampelomyces quisqualis TaxID=50730 RepID=A0A6A5QC82_AMPQU|nr:hypothetical protein BDU57DRAFT_457023 [Ampelomyces quisqualis]
MTVLPTFALAHHAIPRQPGSKDNFGPYVNVVTWILLITSTLAVLTRLITKRALRRRIDVDDAFVVAALLVSIGSGASVSVQAANGLGQHISALTDNQIVTYQKAEYANKLLYIATLVFAKLSIISLLMILTASDLHRNLGIGLTGIIALWGFISEFVAAFQCGSSEPWRFISPDQRCLNMTSFWLSMGVFNILTDLALILFPMHVIVTLQMSLGKKITILVFFGARSLDIIATAIQTAYLYGFSSSNPTRDLWKWTLVTQIIECVTILTSCVPYLRPLLESLPSGLYASDELRRRGTPSELGYSRNKSGSYQLSGSYRNTRSAHGEKQSQTRSQTRTSQNETGIKRFLPMLSQERTTHTNSASGLPGGPRRPDGETGVKIVALKRTEAEDKRWETDSTGSHSKILKTTVVSAEWEEAERASMDMVDDNIEVVK